MKTIWVGIIWVWALVVGGGSAHAFYNPNTGRWPSRDPLDESGGKNLYAMIDNAPITRTDHLGLVGDPGPDPFQHRLFCNDCDGIKYDNRYKCCCKGKVVSRKAIDSGVVKFRWTSTVPTSSGYPYHAWMTWPGGSIDNNAIIGSYMVSSPALGPMLYTAPTPEQEQVKLSPCDYDFDELHNCLSKKASQLKGTSDPRLCDVFVSGILSDCMEESKGCTVK